MLSLLAADGVHAQPAQKAPAAMIVGSAEKRPTPGQEKTFIAARCSSPERLLTTASALSKQPESPRPAT
jgi:hypothetical protein